MCKTRAFHKHWNQHHSNKFENYGGHQRRKRKQWKENFKASFNTPPANVLELDDKYELYLFAPGYEKSDFLIALIDQTLSISVERKQEEDKTWKRQEYIQKGFVRQFELNDKIDKSAIEAKYENGVLILSLPKLEGFETDRQEILVA